MRRDNFVIDGIEEADDLTFDLESMRNRDVAFEQIVNGLRDDGLAIPRGPVHEHRMACIDCRPELIEHRIADDKV